MTEGGCESLWVCTSTAVHIRGVLSCAVKFDKWQQI